MFLQKNALFYILIIAVRTEKTLIVTNKHLLNDSILRKNFNFNRFSYNF